MKDESSSDNFIPSMREAVSSIKDYIKSQGEEITDEELAQKIGISAEQLCKYVADEDSTPKNLTDSLLKAYGIKLVRLVDIKRIDRPIIPPSLGSA